MGHHASVTRAALPIQNNKVKKLETQHGKRYWPHPRVRSLSRVGLGATVGTLKTGYPHIQALSQDEGQDGRSFAPTCLMAPAPASWLKAAPEPPCATWLQLSPPSSGHLWSRHVSRGSSPHLQAQGSSGATSPVAPAPAS
jgi:hypothetical protein